MNVIQIPENMLSQVDSKGNHFFLLKYISDQCKDASAINENNVFLTINPGNLHTKKTTRGWAFQMEWEYGLVKWFLLKDPKQSSVIELSKYAITNKIQEDPAFNWWVGNVFRQSEHIISKFQTLYWIRVHNFEIRGTEKDKEYMEIDWSTGTNSWEKVFQKEMENIRVAFKRSHTR